MPMSEPTSLSVGWTKGTLPPTLTRPLVWAAAEPATANNNVAIVSARFIGRLQWARQSMGRASPCRTAATGYETDSLQ